MFFADTSIVKFNRALVVDGPRLARKRKGILDFVGNKSNADTKKRREETPVI